MSSYKKNDCNNVKGLTSLPIIYNILCGSAAGSIAEICTIHLDTVKVRLMTQGEITRNLDISSNNFEKKYKNIFHCYYIIAKEEGLMSLFKGLSAGIQRQTIFAGLRIGLYPNIRDYISKEKDPIKIPLKDRIFASLLTGCFAICIASPTDVVKIRLQADGLKQLSSSDNNKRRYKNTLDAYKQIINNEGLKGFYRGLSINILRNSCINAAELVSYDKVKISLLKYFKFDPNSKILHMSCGSFAGFIAVSVFSTFDVLKTRIINDNSNKYKSIYDCFKKSLLNEGFKVFYSGYLANLIRVMVWNAFFFISMERCQLFVKDNLI